MKTDNKNKDSLSEEDQVDLMLGSIASFLWSYVAVAVVFAIAMPLVGYAKLAWAAPALALPALAGIGWIHWKRKKRRENS